MVTQPAYLKAFKDYTRAEYGVGAPRGPVIADLIGESDRGAVILAATRIEDNLEWALMQHMKPLWEDKASRSQMFRGEGYVATFAAKTALAYALGIIDKEAQDQIGLIRVIRNGCAHGRLPISFERPELQDICRVATADILSLMSPVDAGAFRIAFCADVQPSGPIHPHGTARVWRGNDPDSRAGERSLTASIALKISATIQSMRSPGSNIAHASTPASIISAVTSSPAVSASLVSTSYPIRMVCQVHSSRMGFHGRGDSR